jgi:hypothetical protein
MNYLLKRCKCNTFANGGGMERHETYNNVHLRKHQIATSILTSSLGAVRVTFCLGFLRPTFVPHMGKGCWKEWLV